MERKPSPHRLRLLSQALSAAASSVSLARQLIREIEREGGALETPGLIGKYDGQFMVTEAGKKYPVPDNYAAKTKLVYGDKLKMIEGPKGRQFKHIGRIPRVEAEAQLSVKDGRLVAVSPEGSYKLIQSAVKFLNGEEGDKIKILLPRDEKHAPFAAILEVIGKGRKKPPRERRDEAERKEKVEKKEEKAVVTVEKAEKPKEEKKVVPRKAVVKKEEKEKKELAKKTVKKEEKKAAPKAKKPAAKVKSAPSGKPPAKKGEAVVAPPGEEELR